MSEEEINEALKIIKEPITVNSIEYKYFNQENYEKLLSVYENAKWFVSNWEQALQNIKDIQEKVEQLEKENEQLRTELNTKDYIINYILQVFENGSFEDGCDCIEIYDYLKQLQDNKYKEVIEYIVQRRNEIENKEDYLSEQEKINQYLYLQQKVEQLEKENEATLKNYGNLVKEWKQLENIRKEAKNEEK